MKDSFRKVALTLIAVLALFVGDALAQCNGKTVNIQLPSGWGPDVYVLWEGQGVRFTTTSDGGEWATFTLSGLRNDAADKREIIFYKSSGARYNDSKIGQGSWSTTAQIQNTNSEKIPCSIFRNSDVIYVMEDPSNPGKTLVSTEPPDAYYFYFLPPSSPEWIMGTPYLRVGGKNIKMDVDTECGWYKIRYYKEDPPEEDALIGLNLSGKELIGKGGIEDATPIPFNLKEQIETRGRDGRSVYFAAAGNGLGEFWFNSRNSFPYEPERCSYNFAAIIFHTSEKANTSFSRHNDNPGEGAEGLCKGIVGDELVDGKIQWGGNMSQPGRNDGNACSGGVLNGVGTNGTGWTEQNFKDAFKSTPGKNVQRCYDMPFERRPNGLWEFDATFLCGDGTLDYDGKGACTGRQGKLNGFYLPSLLQQVDEYGDHRDAYAQCPGCGATYNGNSDIGVSSANQWCYDRGWFGTGSGNLDGLTSAEVEAEMSRVCTRKFRTGELISSGSPVTFTSADGTNNPDYNNPKDITGLLCFESAPAKFIYEPGQEFFFRGDDDIWVYINNRLVIDLGGNHMPAPGYVKLDTISNPPLKADSSYDINIFFCDRRASGSNVRIATNLYFEQANNLTSNPADAERAQGNTLCYSTTQGGGSCQDVMLGGNSSASSDIVCGKELPFDVDWYLSNSRGSKIYLNADNEDCKINGSIMTCYGGIIIDLVNNNVKADAGAFYGYSGRQQVYAEAGTYNRLMASFIPGSEIVVVWGDVYGDDKLIRKFPHNDSVVNVVAGKLIPVGFAKANDRAGGGFDVNMQTQGGSPGQAFSISQTGLTDPNVPGSALEFFSDSLGDRVVLPSDRQQIGTSGLLVLWVRGSSRADNDAEYRISASTHNGLKLNVKLPLIKFAQGANDTVMANPTGVNCGNAQKTCGTDVNKRSQNAKAADMYDYLGTNHARTVVAIDPVKTGPYTSVTTANPSGICTTCNFALNFGAIARSTIGTGKDAPALGLDGNLIEVSGLDLNKGIGKIVFNGITETKADTMVFLKMRGESRSQDSTKHVAIWDSLVFKEPPVPRPEIVWMFDANGDGIADSLYIKYNKPFKDDEVSKACEKLPNAIEVFWDVRAEKPITHKINTATQNAKGEYTNAGISCQANMDFWKQYMRGDSVIVLTGNFSEGIQTKPYETGGKGIIKSWSTFVDESKSTAQTKTQTTIPNSGKIQDRVPAVIADARYKAGTRKDCGVNASNKCADEIVLTFSEPVKPVDEDVTVALAKYGFQYCLVEDEKNGGVNCQYEMGKPAPDDKLFHVYNEEPKNEPVSFLWRKGGQLPNSTTGDSVVTIKYNRFNDKKSGDHSLTPMPKDYVKFTKEPKGEALFMDLAQNLPNPKEQGKNIEGEKPFDRTPIRIADANPKEGKDDIAARISDKSKTGNPYDNIGEAVNEWYQVGKPGKSGAIDFMPVPSGATPDSIKKYYPSTVGVVFKPDIVGKVEALEKKLGTGQKINSGKIVLIAKANIHTNLGNYVVDREFFVTCDDPRFKINGQGDCRSNQSEIYLAWNLRDKKDRLAGSGAYIEVYDFKWRVLDNVPASLSEAKKGKAYSTAKGDDPFDKSSSIEMFGVRRTK